MDRCAFDDQLLVNEQKSLLSSSALARLPWLLFFALACGSACSSNGDADAGCSSEDDCPGTGSGGAATGSGGSGSGGELPHSSGGAGSGGDTSGGGSGGAQAGSCDPGSTTTAWAEDCPTSPYRSCTAGSWVAAGAETGAPLRHQTEHFAFYWPDGTNITLQAAQNAGNTLETIWNTYFGAPLFFPEPYCNQSTKYKASVHFDDDFPLWGGAWGSGYMGMWVGPGAAGDPWGLAHEFMHGVQSVSGGLQCGGPQTNNFCGWIFESHANFAPHQLERYENDVHCSEMLVNAPHLYLGSTRNRYCNWQFMEFLKDKHCHRAVNDIWTTSPASNDPFTAILRSRGWSIDEMNDFFGEYALHNVTWDYRESAAAFRAAYGPLTDTSRPERRNRITRLEPLDEGYATSRRFQSPYYAAPQRYGYNVVRLVPEEGAEEVTVRFRGVVQEGADSDWRWSLVATDAALTTARYGALQRGADGELTFCVTPGEQLWLVVAATPSVQQQIHWDRPYASIYRYPYLVELEGAWPEGYAGGAPDECPAGTVRHDNGGGCAPANLPTSVYVGPNARVLGGNVSGSARIEDQATILNGATVSGGTVGGLTVLSRFAVTGSAQVRTTFYPPGFFESGQGLSGTAALLGDVEYRGAGLNRLSGSFSGFVDASTANMSVTEVTVAPPYAWRP